MTVAPALLIDDALPTFFASLGSSQTDLPRLAEDAIQRLVERARTGDADARARLYEQFVDRVFRTVRGMVRSDADAEDTTQDAMLTMLTSLHRYAPREGAGFTSWVMTVALNTARRRFRRRRPTLTGDGELPDVAVDAPDPAEAIDRARTRRALLTALAELPDRARTVLSLRYGAELNATEIGATLDLTPSAVRKILERSRDRLEARLGELMEDGRA